MPPPTSHQHADAQSRRRLTRDEIARALSVNASGPFDAAEQARARLDFLEQYLRTSGATGYVLGLSGGVDSTTTGRLAQLACTRAGKTFTAVRLPYGAQADEADAQAALAFIDPDDVVTVNIKSTVDALHAAATPAGGYVDTAAADLVKGNIKARIRMSAQYALASARGALVLGTDHAAEAVMGFFTKFGDGAADVAPLSGLTKRQVRAVAKHVGVPDALVDKTPTADLEDERPGLPDEVVYGVTYAQIDAYLEGEPVDAAAAATIERAYAATAHKRALPVTPND
jgi:NAD+ synthase